jgi:hypothetical protein
LKKKLERIDEYIVRYLSLMDEQDTSVQSKSEYTPEQIKAAIKELTERKDKYESFLKELEKTGETQKLTTDPKDIQKCILAGILPSCYGSRTAGAVCT